MYHVPLFLPDSQTCQPSGLCLMPHPTCSQQTPWFEGVNDTQFGFRVEKYWVRNSVKLPRWGLRVRLKFRARNSAYPSANTIEKLLFESHCCQPDSKKQAGVKRGTLAENVGKLFRALKQTRLLKCIWELALELYCPWPLPSFKLFNTTEKKNHWTPYKLRVPCACEQHEKQVSARISRHQKFKVTWFILRKAKSSQSR